MENLYVIVGLGNPGREYAHTRHNAGFLAVDKLASRWKAGDWRSEQKFDAQIARGEWNGRRFCLAQPQTFMNESGRAVGKIREYFKIPLVHLLVIVDDADLPFGEVRMRADGSAGGHHGLESIESHLGTREYARLRVGIGRKAAGQRQIRDYVLGQFGGDESELLQRVLERTSQQVEAWLVSGIAKAMSQFNGVVATPVQKES